MKKTYTPLTSEEFETLIENAIRKSTERTDKEIKKIKERKERLRKALIAAGFDIPDGLTLDEWIPYIERGVRL